jgi:type I restriction enzyme S subunit
MNANRLIQHYERIADTPDTIQRLRRFVSDLAVRGKLVPQDPDDEPASELLKQVAVEKARLVKPGEKKCERSGKAAGTPMTPLALPRGWVWTNLQAICTSITDGDHLPPPKAQSGVPFLVISDVRSKDINYSPQRYVPRDYYARLDPSRQPRTGDLLYTLVGSFGIPVEVRSDIPFCVQRHIRILRPSKIVVLKFLARIMESDVVFRQADACATGIAQKTVPLSGLRNLTVPLPPIAEQHRIAAKIDEMMGLCDRLETARANREATRDRLTTACLSRLNAVDPENFADEACFALNALAALTKRPDQIRQLRKTILNLAVRGKLVPQDPTDEPAKVSASACDRVPSQIPDSWRYTRLGNFLSEDTRNGYSRRPDDAPNGTPILRISAGTLRRDGIVAEEEHKLISGTTSGDRLQYGLKAGDLLACRFNGNKAFVGRLTMFKDYLGIRPIYPDKLIRVRLAPELALPAYLRFAAETEIVRTQVEALCATTVGNWGISATNLKEIRFPVPPLAEQYRIVRKVEELMEVCDRLEASLTTAADTRRRLLDALLAEALAPNEERKLQAAE